VVDTLVGDVKLDGTLVTVESKPTTLFTMELNFATLLPKLKLCGTLDSAESSSAALLPLYK
jgi:hypothetical protein